MHMVDKTDGSGIASGMDKLEAHLVAEGSIDSNGPRLLREVAYERLYDSIRALRLQPGDMLSEPRLSKALGISRTPVREALHLLTQAGMLEIIPGRAILIASPSMRRIMEVLEIRVLLEPEMMALLAGSLSQANQDLWFSITDTMSEAALAGDRVSWSKADDSWHELASQLSPNKVLGEMVLQARNRIFVVSNDENVSDQYLIDGTAEHSNLVTAIAAGQAEEARQIWREHIHQLKEDILIRNEIMK